MAGACVRYTFVVRDASQSKQAAVDCYGLDMRWTPARPAASHTGGRSRGSGRRGTVVVAFALGVVALLYLVTVAPHGQWDVAIHAPPEAAIIGAHQTMRSDVLHAGAAPPNYGLSMCTPQTEQTPTPPRRYANAVDAWMQHYLRIPRTAYNDPSVATSSSRPISVAASLFGRGGNGSALDAIATRFERAPHLPGGAVGKQHSAAFGFAMVDGSSGGDLCVDKAARHAAMDIRFVIGFARPAAVAAGSDQRWYHATCDAYNRDRRNADVFTSDAHVEALARRTFGPDWFEATVVVSYDDPARPSDGGDGFSQPLLFAYDEQRCLYVATESITLPIGTPSTVVCLVDHLHEHWNALRETQEEAHYDYVLQRLAPIPPSTDANPVAVGIAPVWNAGRSVWTLLQQRTTVAPSCRSGATAPTRDDGLEAAERWVSVGADPIPQYHASALKGYWLSYKTMQWQDYQRVPNYHYDYLGRMHFGKMFRRVTAALGSACKVGPRGTLDHWRPTAPAKAYSTRETILRLLRNRVIYFFGDSHMRIFFYGFLSRLGIAYPLDKVWRGDRTDYVREENVTVHFIASYFLNFSRPSAEAMMMDAGHPIVVAGVGQHHSCHCWAVGKHMAVVRAALRDLTLVDPWSSPPQTRDGLSGNDVPTRWRHDRDVVWFGIPAQPYNTHLYRKKPVGQSRRDCRNNARHLLYSAFHHEAIAATSALLRAGGAANAIATIDAFQSSLGMQHTSLDGAHYYTWVREAWIEQLVDALRGGA